MTLVLVWLVFWVNASLFSCCEAIGAGLGVQPTAQSVYGEPSAHAFDETHTDHSDHSHSSPCGHVVSAGPAALGQADVLSAGAPDLVMIPLDVTISLPTVASATSRLTAYPTPPPHVPLYLRELRILL
jgi:hypothetical protein